MLNGQSCEPQKQVVKFCSTKEASSFFLCFWNSATIYFLESTCVSSPLFLVSCNLTSMLQFVSLPFISTLGLFLCLSCVYGHPHLSSGIDSWCWYCCPHNCAHTCPVLQCFHCIFADVCLCQHWLSEASSAILWWYLFGSVSSYSDMQTKHHSKLSLLSRKYGKWSGERGNVIWL